ncbi:hypothetical protein NECAME_16062 [Necator americanus]|uniref:Uncharacterized protein n=1 Tax=Necator americanus TaxID=51031 RepID=W2TYZ5_NECAM|nr:hypothetical protein NECAME_16062 [Necator americanus]ETN86889.1 hypothetical protein NECAME_16062 [Necator americanus]
MTTKTIHGNSQFQKPSSLRWMWESPGGGYRNEIDHIIVNKRLCLTDVAVAPKYFKYPERKDMGHCPPHFGKVSVFVAYSGQTGQQ